MKNIVRMTAALFTILALSPLTGHATDSSDDPAYYLIKDETISFTETDGRKAVPPEKIPDVMMLAGISKTPMAAGAIVNAGASMWNVLNNGSASGGYSSAYASAIPGFSFNWGKITGWKGPKDIIYSYKVTNLMGMDVIRVRYKISFYYGGTEDGGNRSVNRAMDAGTYSDIAAGAKPSRESAGEPTAGAYITNFTIQPVEIDIKWGWKFDLVVKMSDPMNIGTRTNPVAYLQSDLNWTRSTPISTKGGTWTYGVDGNGKFTDLTRKITGINSNLPIRERTTRVPAVNWN